MSCGTVVAKPADRRACERPFLWTLGGRRVDLLAPQPEQIRIEDIARALSNLCRWTGHVSGAPYVVAQHSCLVHDLVRRSTLRFALEALLHDAHEAFLGDVASPVKRLLGDTLPVLAVRFDRVIGARFGATLDPLPDVVRRWDREIQRYEAADLLNVPADEIRRHFGATRIRRTLARIVPWSPMVARRAFMSRFDARGGTR